MLLWMRHACRYFEVQPGGEVGVKNVRPEGDRGAALETKNHTRVVSPRREEEQNKSASKRQPSKIEFASTTQQHQQQGVNALSMSANKKFPE